MEIANITNYVDPWDGSVRFIAFEIWSGDDLVNVLEIRPGHAPLIMSVDFSGAIASLCDQGSNYHAHN